MFAAYCDESYGGDGATPGRHPYYVVAGYCGPVSSWVAFESYWSDSMRRLKIEGLGLHAAKCANGMGPYGGMSEERRNEIQYRMIVDIAASKPLMGFVAAIDLAVFEKYQAALAEKFDKDTLKYNVRHVYAMEMCIELMTTITEDVVPDRIAFFFDRNAQFGGRAGEWYQMRVRRPLSSHHNKLGSYTQDDRLKLIGLQAADLLAYSAFRHISEPNRDRWQWNELMRATHISPPLIADELFWSGSVDEPSGIRDIVITNMTSGTFYEEP
jgi:hypothetical protein